MISMAPARGRADDNVGSEFAMGPGRCAPAARVGCRVSAAGSPGRRGQGELRFSNDMIFLLS